MKERLGFIRLPLALVAIFFVGNLVLGAMGASYDVAKRLFSMVILQTHLRFCGLQLDGDTMGTVLAAQSSPLC